MSNWSKIKLGDLLSESKIESENSSAENRIRVLLNANGVIQRPIMSETDGGTKYYTRKAGQFIYGKQNLHKGAFGVIPKELDGFTSSSDLPSFDVSEKCLPEWINYYLIQNDFYLSLVEIAKGAATKRIQPNELFKIEIPLPEINEQEKIINRFKGLENKFDVFEKEYQTQSQLLSQLRQSILQEAIQGKLTENWRAENKNTEPASELLQRIKLNRVGFKPNPIDGNEIPFELPENWVWCRLGEIVQLISGQDLEKSEYNENGKGTPYITGASHFSNGEINISRWTEFPKSISYKEDLLITVKGTIGTMAYNKIGEIHIARQIMAIRNIYDIEIGYVKICLENLIVELISKAKSLIPGVSREDILTLIIPLPPLSEQHAIVEQVEKLLSKCTALQTEIENLNTHSKTLLKALFAETFDNG